VRWAGLYRLGSRAGGVALAPSSVGSGNFSALENFEAVKSKRSPQDRPHPLPPGRQKSPVSADGSDNAWPREGAELQGEGWPRQ